MTKALEIANLAGLNREELEEIQNRTIWLTDQEGITLYAQEKGREEGRLEGKIELIITILQQKLGEISLENSQKLEQLSSTEIDAIIANIFNVNSWEDLENMLNRNE